MNNQRETQIIRRSTSGNKEIVKNSKRKISKKERIKRLVAGAAICMTIGGVTTIGMEAVLNKFKNDSIIYDTKSEFHQTYITPYTKITEDGMHHYYEYPEIAHKLEKDPDNFYRNVYLSYIDLGTNQTDRILAYTDYETLDNFLSQNGITNKDEWNDKEKQKIILTHEISEKEEELKQMSSENNNKAVEDNSGKGEK